MPHLVRVGAVAALAAFAYAALHPASAGGQWLAEAAVAPAVQPPLPSLAGATAWINSPPLTAKALQGKVVLVDFWTYSCINCLRTLPYVKAWAQKYGEHGLVVIGAHTPEFDFERSVSNVQRAVKDLQIRYPVAVDSQQTLWNAFGTQAWPTFYFVDATGRIRYRQLGEGRYDQAERMIQELLREAGQRQVPDDLVVPQATGTQAAVGPRPPASDETYLGWARGDGFVAAAGELRDGGPRSYTAAPQLRLNQWTLAGRWRVDTQQLSLAQPGGSISYRFRARDLHLVLGPGPDGRPVRFRIRLDGQPPGADHGSDVLTDGSGTVETYRLYQLVRQAADGRERLFEIEFLDADVQAHAFTFG
ncbi:redoxin family protein [Roseateles sp. YR242]|uniref:redoxin family protein n=1 Tax=Roseateles sp. YR242 TaxID=1855305 RepID=UPI002101A3C6|nr:redoxin family protein [Roseateles sp. YR242]